MPNKQNNARQKFTPSKMIYPGITIVFVILVILLFSRAIVFLSTNINKVFSNGGQSLQEQVPQFDLASYQLVRRRFGWPDTTTSSSSITSISSSTPAH